jgi:hypothetical protein
MPSLRVRPEEVELALRLLRQTAEDVVDRVNLTVLTSNRKEG